MVKSLLFLLLLRHFFSLAKHNLHEQDFFIFSSPQFITLSNIIDDAKAKRAKFVEFSTLMGKKEFPREFHKNSNRKGWWLGEMLGILCCFCWEIMVHIGGDSRAPAPYSSLPAFFSSIAKCERNFIDKHFLCEGEIWINFTLWGAISHKSVEWRARRTTRAETKLLVILIGIEAERSEVIVIYRCILWCSKSSLLVKTVHPRTGQSWASLDKLGC